MSALASACPNGWHDGGAWFRALLVSLSTVVLNTWLAYRITRSEPRRGTTG